MLNWFENLFAPPRDLLLVILALWAGLALVDRRTHRHPIDLEALNNVLLAGFSAYLLGGRLFYVLENLASFAVSPLSIFSFNINMFDQTGAVAAACIAAWVAGQRAGLPLWPTLDALTPLLAALAVGLALSNLASGAGFGGPTQLPWAIFQWNAWRHPVQLYALLADSAILVFVLWRRTAPPGVLALLFAALSSCSRLFLEAFRGDSTLLAGNIREAQVLAWLALAASLAALEYRLKSPVSQAAPLPARPGRRPARKKKSSG
jgi:phosphatidylglycerol:prolipoprotein diacylglycerol transferase